MSRIMGFILLSVIIIVGGGLWYWQTHKKRIIRSELEKAINAKSQGLYKVNYAGLELDELSGNLSISSFTLSYDSTRYVQLQKEKKEPYLLFTIFIPRVQVTGVKTDRALIKKELTGSHLVLQNPVIEILYTNAGKDSSRNVPGKEIYQQILSGLELIKLDTVIISGAEITTKSMKTGRISVHFSNISINMFDVKVDSIANADSSRLLFAKELNLDCEKFTWQSRNNVYKYEANSVAFRSAASSINIKDFYIKPLLNQDAFVRKFPVQTDRFDIAIRNIQLRNADFFRLTDEYLKADSLLIGSASLKIYRDRNRPPDTEDKVGDYPHQLIQRLPIQLDINKAFVRNADIEYTEKSSITHQAGKVQLWNSSAYISNITNRKETIATNNIMVVDMQSRLLNKIPISATWTFYLGNGDGKFHIKGKTGGADATLLNPLTVPMGPVELTSGHINSLGFDLAGTNYHMTGDLRLLYDDLHIAVLKKDDDSVHFKKRKVTSLLANMKIRNKNPEKDEAPRISRINYKRNVQASIFNLVWKSLFTGVEETIGTK
jgi:hypothetical protein